MRILRRYTARGRWSTPCSPLSARCPDDRVIDYRERRRRMPGALSYGFKVIAVSALTIAISLGRVEMANAYHQPSDTSQIANDGGKEKGDKGKEKNKEQVNSRSDVKADSKNSEKTKVDTEVKADVKARTEVKAKDEVKVEAKSETKSDTKVSDKKSEDKGSKGTNTSGGSEQNGNTGSNGHTGNSSHSNKGNNGTVKIINDQGDATDDQDEDSHVCLFHIFGFNFDANQSGTWDIAVHSPGGGPLTATQSHGAWAAGSDGKFDARPVTQPFPSGHYKLTVNTGMGDGKHKVFWVQCGTPVSKNHEAAKVREHLMSAINSAQNVSAQLATTISIAQQLILSGTLNSTELANITSAREAAITAANTLAINLTAAQNALVALNTAIASGTAEQIAAAVTTAEQAIENLKAAANAAANANAQLGATIAANSSAAEQTRAQLSAAIGTAQNVSSLPTTTPTTTGWTGRAERETVETTTGNTSGTTAGSTATGTTTAGTTTGSTAVAGVQTPPQTGAATQTATQGGSRTASSAAGAGVQNLPSTNTSNDATPLALLGVTLMAIGGALLRRSKGLSFR